MDIFLYLVAAFTLLTFLVTIFRYWRTKARPYLLFSGAFFIMLDAYAIIVALDVVYPAWSSAITLSPTSSSGSNSTSALNTAADNLIVLQNSPVSRSLVLGLLVGSACVVTLGSLAFELAFLSLLGMWLWSMQGHLPDNKYTRGMTAVRMLRILFPIMAMLAVVFRLLFMFVSATLVFGFLAVAIIYAIAELYLLAITIWLMVGVQKGQSATMGQKRRQIAILIVFALFSAYGVGLLLGGNVNWLVRCLILLWPGTLEGFDMVPESVVPESVEVSSGQNSSLEMKV